LQDVLNTSSLKRLFPSQEQEGGSDTVTLPANINNSDIGKINVIPVVSPV